MKYKVELSAIAYVSGIVEVEANDTYEAETEALQIAWAGDILWKYAGTTDDSERVDRIEETT